MYVSYGYSIFQTKKEHISKSVFTVHSPAGYIASSSLHPTFSASLLTNTTLNPPMGLKRNAPSSDDEDHDADFQLSDRAASSAVSRLKRPKRRTSRHPSSTPPSSHLANDHEGEESDEVIFVPDSLEQDDDVTVQNHKPADHSTNPQHPQNTSSPASNQKQNADHDNSDPPIISETPPDAITTSPPQRSPRETAHPSKAATDTSPG